MNSKPSGGYAVAQNNSNSNMSSASVTNASSSTQTNSPYKFERGYPAPSTAERAYNDTDLSRAIEAYKFFYPTMSTESLFQDLFAGLESKQSGIKFHAGPRHEFLTGNGDTPYGSGLLDLNADGPMVVELPPSNFIGLIQDHNMRWIVDIGINGPDKGQGGKYLILPPDYQGDVPTGYNVSRSDTWKVLLFVRYLSPEGNMTQALDAFDGIKVYPLAKAGEADTFHFVDITNEPFVSNLLKWENNLEYLETIESHSRLRDDPCGFPCHVWHAPIAGYREGKTIQPRRPHD